MSSNNNNNDSIGWLGILATRLSLHNPFSSSFLPPTSHHKLPPLTLTSLQHSTGLLLVSHILKYSPALVFVIYGLIKHVLMKGLLFTGLLLVREEEDITLPVLPRTGKSYCV